MKGAEYTAIISKFGRKLETKLATDFDTRPETYKKLLSSLECELTKIQFIIVDALLNSEETEKGNCS